MNHQILFQKIKKLVHEERRIGVEILECLWEIERRKAYSELRYDGLFSYCVKELGFTESQAFQRIQAMRAVHEIPEIKPLISRGSLSVTAVSKVQTHLRQYRKEGKQPSRSQKLDLFHSMSGCTLKEVDSKLAEIRGERLKVRLILELTEETEELWIRVKNLAAHKTEKSTEASQDLAAFKILMSEWLKKNDPGMWKVSSLSSLRSTHQVAG